jgi:predicted dehydrogenase
VLCEKPLAMNLQETSALITIARERPRQLSLINHQLRFNPYIVKVREMIADGAIGRPYFLRMHQQSTSFADRQAPWNWSFDSDQGGGVRLAIGSHLIDLLHYWFRVGVIAVQGAMDPVVRERRGLDGVVTTVKASGFFSASLELESGMSVHLSATAASCGQPAFDFDLYGEEGELHFDLTRKLRGAFLSNRGAVEPIAVNGVTERERDNKVSIFSGSFMYFAPEIVKSLESSDWSDLEAAARFVDAYKVQVVLDALAASANDGALHRLSGRERNSGYV